MYLNICPLICPSFQLALATTRSYFLEDMIFRMSESIPSAGSINAKRFLWKFSWKWFIQGYHYKTTAILCLQLIKIYMKTIQFFSFVYFLFLFVVSFSHWQTFSVWNFGLHCVVLIQMLTFKKLNLEEKGIWKNVRVLNGMIMSVILLWLLNTI